MPGFAKLRPTSVNVAAPAGRQDLEVANTRAPVRIALVRPRRDHAAGRRHLIRDPGVDADLNQAGGAAGVLRSRLGSAPKFTAPVADPGAATGCGRPDGRGPDERSGPDQHPLSPFDLTPLARL